MYREKNWLLGRKCLASFSNLYLYLPLQCLTLVFLMCPSWARPTVLFLLSHVFQFLDLTACDVQSFLSFFFFFFGFCFASTATNLQHFNYFLMFIFAQNFFFVSYVLPVLLEFYVNELSFRRQQDRDQTIRRKELKGFGICFVNSY